MPRSRIESASFEPDPLWYKDAIIYQLHPRAFFDSNGDGIGDFRGMTRKLDYIQDLGVTAIWILPFYPSPLRDDGYDIADYTDVHPDYGTVTDVRRFVREAHDRGLRVITELVCNHTSDQHPWFQRARTASPGSAARNYYVWSDDPEKYSEARIIFKDFESSNWTWDSVAEAYFWHRFYHHQPDLNFDNPRVRKSILSVMDFWLRMGVDGLRLDAIPYLIERDGTNGENLPETHEVLKELRRHIDDGFDDRMLLAEANQWPEDAVAYFGDGDECHMSFHFPLMPRMFMALRMEDRYPIVDIMAQTPDIPPTAQWSLFLRNHDELTLEMVTDEERDYMYRVYAHDPQMRINLGIRRRLAPLLGNNRRRIELMNGLLFSLPGTPVIYYGDEIGMGDNIYLGDRNSVRTPMQWSADRNAGFSSASRQRLYLPIVADAEYHYETVNVEAQQNNPHSLLWWMKRLIALRKRYQAFGRGTLTFLHPDNRKILAFVREFENERILVIANLSRFVQAAELDLSHCKGMVPVELFGQTEFPSIGELPYFITLGPHAFYLFSMEHPRVDGRVPNQPEETVPTLATSGEWEHFLVGQGRSKLEAILPEYIGGRRWFGSKSRKLKGVRIVDSVSMPYPEGMAQIAFIQTDFVEGDSETYLLPVTQVSQERADDMRQWTPQAIIANLSSRISGPLGALVDAAYEPSFATALLDAVRGRRRLRGTGEVRTNTTRALRSIAPNGNHEGGSLNPSNIRAEQSNSSLTFDEKLILKLYRRLEPGLNPDLEVGLFLTERGFEYTPPVCGWLEYRSSRGETSTLGILHGYVPNEGDVWSYTGDVLRRYYERTAASPLEADLPATINAAELLHRTESIPPEELNDLFETYLDDARMLGERTAQMHLTLARGTEPAFKPEPFTTLYQRSIYQRMRGLSGNMFPALRRKLPVLPDDIKEMAQVVSDYEQEVVRRYRMVIDHKIDGVRTRCHGDFHLGQVLHTGRDFSIIDFEGEPARALGERRLKRSPLTDVAGMLRSFHYAAYATFFEAQRSGLIRPEDAPSLDPWARFWTMWVSSYFLKGYLSEPGIDAVLPSSREDLQTLLDAFVLEKAVYEVGYEMNSRPEWLAIPLSGILQIIGDGI
ncbi:MAG: maltose alpha-D-glucosyltransferase [Nitrolancea sp.]